MKRSSHSTPLHRNMNASITSLIAFVMMSTWSFCAESSSFETGNQRFEQGKFSEAAKAYEESIINEGPRASTYYNLGNSHYRLGNHGRAILAYERARSLTPRDSNLLANLALARKAANITEPSSQPMLDAVVNALSRNEWSWMLMIFAGLLAIASLLCACIRSIPPWRKQALPFTVGLFAVLICFCITALYLRRGESQRGILITKDATIRISPFAMAESVGTLGMGNWVTLGEKKGDFQYVRVPGGSLEGWVASADVARVISGGS